MDQDPIETQAEETESLEYSPETQADETVEEEISETQAAQTETSETTEGQESLEKVPVKAIQDERAKRQVLEQQLSDLSKRFDRVVEALVANQPKKEEEKPAEPEFPDWQSDPLGHLKANLAYLTEQLKKINEGSKVQEQVNQQKSASDQLHNRWIADISRFSTDHPDVHEAFAFLAKTREAELSELGYSPQEILQNISNDTRDIVSRAYRSNKDPVEMLYKQAKNRGFAKHQATKGVEKKKSDPRTVRGFDNAGGKRGPAIINAEAIGNMSEDEFDSFMKDKSWKSLHS